MSYNLTCQWNSAWSSTATHGGDTGQERRVALGGSWGPGWRPTEIHQRLLRPFHRLWGHAQKTHGPISGLGERSYPARDTHLRIPLSARSIHRRQGKIVSKTGCIISLQKLISSISSLILAICTNYTLKSRLMDIGLAENLDKTDKAPTMALFYSIQ